MSEASVRKAVLEELRLLEVRDAAQDDPKHLINEIRYFDPTSELWVEFKMFPPEGWVCPDLSTGPAEDWFWQAEIIDWWQDPEIKKYLILKARQLGLTLLACARALWLLLFRPGSASVAFSYKETEAKKLVEATWAMYQSLPEMLRNHVEVLSPHRSEMPSEWIKLKHKDGRISTFQALPGTKKDGHGGRVTWAIMDEVARQDYARDIYTAINPAIGRGKTAKLVMISTANGVSNADTGEGNYFHHLYKTHREKNIAFQFLPWNLEPSRDDAWYAEFAMGLDEVERNQQYPLNESDAFMLSGALYFDRDALRFYGGEIKRPIAIGQFNKNQIGKSRLQINRRGAVEIFENPRPEGMYAMGVDTATGRGSDYTSGDVIDLSSGAIVATYHEKAEATVAAVQIHYLGKQYNNAKVAVERQGGYGEAIIVALRDGTATMPAYSNLYRHTRFTSGAKPISQDYGLPMASNRPQIVQGLATLLRERLFPWMTAGHMSELGSFVYRDVAPSPRAQDGCNDDRVMSLAIAVEMYRQFGQRPDKRRTFKKRAYRPHPIRQSR